jgi:hypothetical protein
MVGQGKRNQDGDDEPAVVDPNLDAEDAADLDVRAHKRLL